MTAATSRSLLVFSEVRKDAARELDINDLKGDGRMTSDAECVLLMYQPQDRLDPRAEVVPMTVHIAKGRDGMKRSDVPMWFDFARYRFLDQCPKASAVGSSHSRAHRRGTTSRSQGPDPLGK